MITSKIERFKWITLIILLLTMALLIVVFLMVVGREFVERIIIEREEIGTLVIFELIFYAIVVTLLVLWSFSRIKRYARELEHSNKLKDLFTDIMRHDLLNPAGIIRNYAELLLKEESDKQRKQELRSIEESAEKLIKMIENASKFAKLESAEKLDFQKQDLNAIWKGVIGDFRPFLEEKSMKVEYDAKGEYLAKINPVIETVFANLLSNAIKFSPEKSNVVIRLEDEDDKWRVMVKDHGIGIPDEDKQGVFERFKRIEKGGVKGTGLGLAIVKKAVELHKGRVWIEDNPEGGSIFYVSLPKVKQ